ncbi:MAG: type glyceraldehyde-3-phosphate dehydrogenase, partial [Pseudomonadota bacterium]
IQRTFVQDNHSKSAKGVLRGMHYQAQNPQGKLVRVLSWYDNEWGFSNRMLDTAGAMAKFL